MTKNRAVQIRNKMAKSYLIFAAVFIVLFGSITLLALFIARLSL